MSMSMIDADADADPKQLHQELHMSERTIVPRTVTFFNQRIHNLLNIWRAGQNSDSIHPSVRP